MHVGKTVASLNDTCQTLNYSVLGDDRVEAAGVRNGDSRGWRAGTQL